MKKNLVIGLLVFILIIILAGYYINTIFLPVQLKNFVLSKAQQRLNGRPISIEAINFSPLRGVVIQNATIFRQDDHELPFLSVKEAHVSIPLPSILKKQKIIIPSITIKKPYIHLIRSAGGEWNFTDLKTRHQDKAKKPIPFILGKIVIDGARIDLTDMSGETATTITLKETDLSIGLSISEGVKFSLQSQLPEQKAYIDVAGLYGIKSKVASADVSLENLLVSQFLPFFPSTPKADIRHLLIKNSDLKLAYSSEGLKASGYLITEADLDVKTSKTYTIKGEATLADLAVAGKGTKWNIASKLSTKNARLQFDNKAIVGDLHSTEIRMALPQSRTVDLMAHFILEGGHIQMGESHTISGDLAASNFMLHFKEGDSDITGNFEINRAQAVFDNSLQMTGRVQSKSLELAFHNKQLKLTAPFSLFDSDITIRDTTKVLGQFSSDNLQISVANDQVNVQGRVMAEDGRITYLDKSLSGSPSANVVLDYDMTRVKPMTYSGEIAFRNETVTGVPKIGNMTGLSGLMKFDNSSLSTELLKFTALQTPAELTGSLRNYKDPSIVFRLESQDADLEALSSLYGPFLSKHELGLKGKLALFVSYAGVLSAPKEGEEKVVVDFKNSSLNGKSLPGNFDSVYGRVTYDKNLSEDSIRWDNLRFNFKDSDYTSTGKLSNISRPLVEATVNSQNLNFITTFKILNKAFTIVSFEGAYFNSPFDVRGEIHLKEQGNPDLDLRGRVNLDISDLTVFPFLPTAKIKPINPDGSVDIDYLYRGPAKNWRAATAVISAQSFEATIKGMKLNDVKAKLEQGDRQYTHLDATAKFYNGSFHFNSLLDPKRENLPFKVTARLAGTDLNKLKKDTPLRRKTLAGLLDADLSLAGPVLDPQSYVGSGSLSISEGNIWEFKLLKGLWSLLLIEEFEHIVFTDASSHFVVKDRRLMTDDLILKGTAVDLKGRGWIDFDRKINFDISPKFKKTELFRSKDMLKGPSAILTGAEGFINIKVTGTLNRPRYEKTVSPQRIFKDTTEALTEGVQSILNDLF